MIWKTAKNYEEMSRIGARAIYLAMEEKLSAGGRFCLGLATGNTMLRLYELLAELLNRSKLPLRKLETWNLDEYVNECGELVAYSHPLSYRKYMNENFFSRLAGELNFPRQNAHFPEPNSPAEFDRLIAAAGGIDLQLLGIGFNGHIGFNEPMRVTEISPGEFALLPSRVIELEPATLATNRRLTAGGKDIVPRRAVTMGMKAILNAERKLLLACFQNSNIHSLTLKWVKSPLSCLLHFWARSPVSK